MSGKKALFNGQQLKPQSIDFGNEESNWNG